VWKKIFLDADQEDLIELEALRSMDGHQAHAFVTAAATVGIREQSNMVEKRRARA
jgi:hypothetical protein